MDTTTKPLIDRSETIIEIAKALSKFQASIENVTKDAENPFYKSSFATLGNILDSIRKPLGENGLSVAQFPVEDNKLVTLVMHISGEYLSSTLKMTPKDTSPQALGSSISYARRYALSSILGVASRDEDDDGEAATAKTSRTTVIRGKDTDEYAKAVIAIEKATKTATLEEMLARLENTKFTDTQKTHLETLISRQIDVLTVKQEK